MFSFRKEKDAYINNNYLLKSSPQLSLDDLNQANLKSVQSLLSVRKMWLTDSIDLHRSTSAAKTLPIQENLKWKINSWL